MKVVVIAKTPRSFKTEDGEVINGFTVVSLDSEGHGIKFWCRDGLHEVHQVTKSQAIRDFNSLAEEIPLEPDLDSLGRLKYREARPA